MKTGTLDVGGMSSMLAYRTIEKQLKKVEGVHAVTASAASNSATIEYDKTELEGLKDRIDKCGFHCVGTPM